MSRPRIRPIVLIVSIAIGTVAGGGVAYAYWSAGGSGSATGVNGTTSAVTLSAGTPTASLYPGGSANVVLTVSNPNTSRIHIGSLILDTSQGASGFSIDAGHPACGTTTFTYTTQTNSGSGWTVPGKVGGTNGTLSITLPSALAMGLTASNSCQGATTTVYLAATP